MDDKRQGGRRAALTGRRQLPVALVLCVGVLLSLAVFLFMRAQERLLLEAELNLHAAKYAAMIQDGIDFNLAMVRATGALYAVSDFVDQDEFEVFFGTLQKGRRPGEVQALAWAPRVPDDERDAFEAAARAEGLAGFRIMERDGRGERVPAGRRGEYFPLRYLAPLEGREKAMGFDIASEFVRLEALEQARDSGEMIATGWIVPAREGDDERRGVLVLRPVYGPGPAQDGIEARRASLTGFVVGLLYVDFMVDAALRGLQPVMLDIVIHDETAPPERRLLHVAGSPDGRDVDGMRVRLPLQMPGRAWSATFTPNPGFFSGHAFRQALGALGAGLLATALLGLLVALRERDRGRIEQAHREWVDAFDAVRDPIFLHDRKGRLLRANLAYAERAELAYRQLIGRPYWEVFPKLGGPLPGCRKALKDSGGREAAMDEIALESGEIFLSRAYAVRDDSDHYRYSIHVMEDVTEQRKAEAALNRLNRVLVTLSHANEALIHAVEEDALIRRICEIIVGDGGFRMAWVGYAGTDGTLRMAASAGDYCEAIAAMATRWSGDEAARCPCGLAVRTGRRQVVNEISTDADSAPWCGDLRACGIGSVIGLPLLSNGEAFGSLNVYADEPGAFTPAIVEHLEELGGDLSFGLRSLRIKDERDEAHGALGKTLLQTIEAVARIAEMRDPYTAGHQRRVADLAVAIAAELGLDEFCIEGIRVGALVHDIGKVAVPAEILTRPGRLSDLEFGMIKGHPQAGYDILKDVSFPWPVREMILQHHERLDGSGYPNGLKDGQILLEARILAVADTVEAMSTHRPYRPGLGGEAAIAEIERGRGSLYDERVADACIRLFREKGFRWA